MTDVYTKLDNEALAKLQEEYQLPDQTKMFNDIVEGDEGRRWIFSLVQNQVRHGYCNVKTFKVSRVFYAPKNDVCFVYVNEDFSDTPDRLFVLPAQEAQNELTYVLNEVRPRITRKRKEEGVLCDLPTIYLEVIELLGRRYSADEVEANKPIYVHPECHTTYDRYLTITGGVTAPSSVDIGEWRMIREIYPDGRILTFCGRTCLPCDALNEKVLASYFSTINKQQMFYALVIDTQKETAERPSNSQYQYPHHFYE